MVTVCACCGDEAVVELAAASVEARVAGTRDPGMQSVVSANGWTDLDEHGKALIRKCADCLLDGRITISNFIWAVLGVAPNTGYDYYLMCFLDDIDVMEHGSGIRCGWFSRKPTNPLKGRELSEAAAKEFDALLRAA